MPDNSTGNNPIRAVRGVRIVKKGGGGGSAEKVAEKKSRDDPKERSEEGGEGPPLGDGIKDRQSEKEGSFRC